MWILIYTINLCSLPKHRLFYSLVDGKAYHCNYLYTAEVSHKMPSKNETKSVIILIYASPSYTFVSAYLCGMRRALLRVRGTLCDGRHPLWFAVAVPRCTETRHLQGPRADRQRGTRAVAQLSRLVTQAFRKLALSDSLQHIHQAGGFMLLFNPPWEHPGGNTSFCKANVYAHNSTCALRCVRQQNGMISSTNTQAGVSSYISSFFFFFLAFK